MTVAPLRRLRADRRGSVITEFAAWSAILFVLVMVALDFGGYYIARGKVNEAISAAAIKAFQNRDTAGFSDLPGFVRNLAQNQSLAVTISCNGVASTCTNTSRTCACLKSDGTYTSATCSAVCSGSGMTTNSVAGYYLTIKASTPYTPILVPRSLLSSTNMSQSATVRLQ